MEHLDSAEDDDDERSRMLDCLKFSEAEIEYVKTFQNSIRVHEPAGFLGEQFEHFFQLRFDTVVGNYWHDHDVAV